MLTRTCSMLIATVGFLFASCASPPEHDVDAALARLSADTLVQHVKVLSSDEFEGRAPSSAGEEKTVQYLKEEFEKVGAQPGNGDSYFQEVPLVEITANPDMTLSISGGKSPMSFSRSRLTCHLPAPMSPMTRNQGLTVPSIWRLNLLREPCSPLNGRFPPG